MSGMRVVVSGEDIAARHIDEMGRRAANLRPAFAKIRTLLQKGFGRNFATHGAYFGRPWPALDADTISEKGTSEAMVRTGKLRAALMGGAGRSSTVTGSSLSVGTSLWYAHFGQEGNAHQPARALVGVSPTDFRASIEIIQNYVIHGLI